MPANLYGQNSNVVHVLAQGVGESIIGAVDEGVDHLVLYLLVEGDLLGSATKRERFINLLSNVAIYRLVKSAL